MSETERGRGSVIQGRSGRRKGFKWAWQVCRLVWEKAGVGVEGEGVGEAVT